MTVIKRSSTDFQRPSKIDLLPRADSLETDSRGCVVCPTPTPQGPTCKKGEEQLLRTQTCDQCPEYYCSPIDGGGGSGAPIGPIVGGTVGGVVALLVAGLLYYFLVWKKKHPHEDDEDLPLSDLENDQDDKDTLSNESILNESTGSPNPNGGNGSNGGSRNGSGSVDNLRNSTGGLDKPPTRRVKGNANLNRRLSSYESFTRPQTRYKGANNRSNKRQSRRVGQRQLKSQNLVQSPYLDPNSNNRNSMATTISTTNASNILPIAYIPGVTVRPTKNNTKSIYSYETDSVFSDLNTIENASIIGDIMKANNYNGQESQHKLQQLQQLQEQEQYEGGDPNQDNTMTAIRGQPRLVNVDRIEEEDEDEEDLSDLESNTYSVKNNISGDLMKNNKTITTTTYLNDSTLSNITGDIQEENETDDSDVDSDIGEIQRATSVRRTEANQVRQINSQSEILIDTEDHRDQKEIPIDLIDLGKPVQKGDDHSINGSSNGSFVLDVEIDNQRPDSQASGERSPFEDP